jgi:hypothetical protein
MDTLHRMGGHRWSKAADSLETEKKTNMEWPRMRRLGEEIHQATERSELE